MTWRGSAARFRAPVFGRILALVRTCAALRCASIRWGAIASAAIACAALCSCALVSLGGLELESHPGSRGEVIGAEEALAISFSLPVDRRSAEGLLRVSSAEGTHSGDFTWDGNRLSFMPVPPLPKGRRLLLSFSGELLAADNRRFTVFLEIPFFVGTDEPSPRLLSASPGDGESAGSEEPIVFTFSTAMDQRSFSSNFTLSPSASYTVDWSADGAAATVTPKEKWTAFACYSWTIETDLRSATGVALGALEEGRFLVQEDVEAPRVVRTQPAQIVGESFFPIDASLDALAFHDCILVSFSEEVGFPSLEAAFSVQPATAGHLLRAASGVFAFVPDEGWRLGTTHHLRVAADTEDLAGNRMAGDYDEWFVPAIPEQRLVSLSMTGVAAPLTLFNSPDPVDCTLDVSGEILFSLRFAEPYAVVDQPRVQEAVDCLAFFPDSVTDPALIYAQWISSRDLALKFGGFTVGGAGSPHYYRLLVPGGEDGVPNADGSYLPEDAWVVFIAR